MISGITARLMFKSGNVAYITNWSIDNSRELIEVNSLGNIDKEVAPGVSDWTASAEGVLAFKDGVDETLGQAAIVKAMEDGELVSFNFVLDTKIVDNNTVPNYYFTGVAIIESVSISASVGELPNISISISGTSKLEFATPPTAAANDLPRWLGN